MINFQGIPPSEVVTSIQKKGYFYLEKALAHETVDQLLSEINFDQILVNNNNVGPVISGTQRFLTHCLSTSKQAYDAITSPKVLEICDGYFTDRYQITNHRFCQTRESYHMPWHTDNNLQTGSQLTGKHRMPGLLFLFYLSEENVSPFQYIESSHTWSDKHDSEIYLSDRWVTTHHSEQIKTFHMTKGSLMICNIHGIHRAVPFQNRYHQRNIFLFQIDQVGDRYLGHGEQNLINTAFIDNPSPKLFSYLGFGIQRNYPAFPNSSVATMKLKDLISLQKQLLPLTFKAIGKTLVKSLFPGEAMVTLKRAAWAAKAKP